MKAEEIFFKIVGIEMVSKSLTAPNRGEEPPKFHSFEIMDELRVHAESKIIIGYVQIRIIKEDDKSKELASLGISCLFTVDNFESVILMDEQKVYRIPPDLENVIRPISISTARGVLYSELRGTFLHNVIMPVVLITPKTELPQETSK